MLKKNIERFFTDNDGHWSVIQIPNIPLLIWILLGIVSFFFPTPTLQSLQRAVLMVWSYLELTEGTSPFRRTLGAIVLAYTVLSFFLR